MTFKDRLRAVGFETYAEYLRSAHWKRFRTTYRNSGLPMTCAVCCRGPVHLHHHTYTRLGKERVTDITPLCEEHHRGVHEWLALHGKMVEQTRLAVVALGGAVVSTAPAGPPKVKTPKDVTAADKRARGRKKSAAVVPCRSDKAKHMQAKQAVAKVLEKHREVGDAVAKILKSVTRRHGIY